MPSDKVYEAAARDNAEWKQFKKDFVAHWEAQRGPNSTEQALEALRHFIPSLDNGVGGEPLFSPLILPAGMALPELAQRESHGFLEPVRATVCTAYVVGREYSRTIRSGEGYSGLQENGKGEKDTAEITGPTFRTRGNTRSVKAAEFGRGGRWQPTRTSRQSELIEPFMESGLMRDMMAGYRQGNSSAPLLQAGRRRPVR